jgi:hypothetical protein
MCLHENCGLKVTDDHVRLVSIAVLGSAGLHHVDLHVSSNDR